MSAGDRPKARSAPFFQERFSLPVIVADPMMFPASVSSFLETYSTAAEPRHPYLFPARLESMIVKVSPGRSTGRLVEDVPYPPAPAHGCVRF